MAHSTVVACFSGKLRVVEIFTEETQRPLAVYMDHNLTFLAVGHRLSVGIHKVYAVLWPGTPHRAGLWLHPGIGAYGEGGFGLAEALHELDAREPQPFLVDARIESFAGNGAVTQRRKVVGAHIVVDQEAEYGGRSAEGCDMVVGKHTEYVGRHEFVEVIHEDFRSGNPLPVEFAPHGFAPAGIGHGEMARGGIEVMPAGCGDYVAKGICEIVSHHLRFAGGAGREV